MTSRQIALKNFRLELLARSVETRPGVQPSDVQEFERVNAVRLTAEAEAYFLEMDGMPADLMDPVTKLRLWRLNELSTSDVPAYGQEEDGDKYFIFADYMLWSHAYAIRLGVRRRDVSDIVVVGGSRPTIAADSLLDFLTTPRR